MKSRFDGGLLQLIGWKILGMLLTVYTLGICYPLAVCMVYGWEIRHTVIENHRLRFDATALRNGGGFLFRECKKYFVKSI